MSNFQPLSDAVYQSKYQLTDKKGNIIDVDRHATFRRVAKALAAQEKNAEYWEEEFYKVMCMGAIPAGRITSNAGANEHKPNTSLINCLAGDTPVLTNKGIQSIRSLVDQSDVFVLNGNSDWIPVKFFSGGVQPVYEVSFRFADSKSITKVKATANHRWIMPNGRVITTEFWLTGGFSKGFCTIPNLRSKSFEVVLEEYNSGFIHGLVFGDGNRNHYHEDEFDLTLCHDKMELTSIVSNILNMEFYGPYLMNKDTGTQATRFTRIFSSVNLKDLPSEDVSLSYIKGFFAGLLATDGAVHGSDGRSINVLLYGQKNLMNYLDKYLPIMGILRSGVIKKLAEKGQSTNFGKRNKDLYGFPVHPSTVDPNDLFLQKHKNTFRITQNGLDQIQRWHYVEINTVPILDEVFCCEEPETQSFCIHHGMLTGNCVLSGIIYDSIDGIGQSVKESLMTLSTGAGIGYCFSTLRPKGAHISGLGARTSGPIPFADIFDKGCFTIASAGGRRGAQMATFDVRHPDVIDFIKAKREDGKFRQFNISVLLPDEFFNDENSWTFRFPIRKNDPSIGDSQRLWDFWHVEDENYIKNEQGQTLFKEYGKVNKTELLDLVLKSNYDYAEPGVIFVDRLNKENNLWFCEYLNSTNPCITGDTKIAVAGQGAIAIKDLVESGVDVPVFCQNLRTRSIEVSMGRNPRKTGEKQKVYKVVLDDGSSFKTTENHGLYLRDGTKIKVSELMIGDSLLPFHQRVDHVPDIYVKSVGPWVKEQHLMLNYKDTILYNFGTGRGKYHAHHIDGNHTNNVLSNLQALRHEDHNSLHLTQKNPMQFWWSEQTDEQKELYRQKMSEATSGENNGMYGKLHTDKTKSLIGAKTSERFLDKDFKSKHLQGVLKSQTDEWKSKISSALTKEREIVETRCAVCSEPFQYERMLGSDYVREFCSRTCVSFHASQVRAEQVVTEQTRHLIGLKSKEFANTQQGKRAKSVAGKKSIQQRAMKCGSYLLSKGYELTKDSWDSLKDILHKGGIKPTVSSGKIIDYWDGDWSKFVCDCKDFNHKVLSVEFVGYEDVYNITVDKHHNYFIVTNEFEKNGNSHYSGILSQNCGEQPLPPYGACLLGSIDLTRFVEHPFTSEAHFNWESFSHVVRVFTRLLDNVVELSNLPLPEQQQEIFEKRRHGMGFFGLGSVLVMMGIQYNSKIGTGFGAQIAKTMALEGFKVGVELAKEKGPAPIFEKMFTVTNQMVKTHPLAEPFFGQELSAKSLFIMGHYMQRLCALHATLGQDLLEYGCRFTHHTSIAPTGTISLAMGDNASGGLEPSFSHHYYRNVTKEGKKTRQQESVYSKEYLLYKEFRSHIPDEELLASLPDCFVTADSLHWKDHINMVAAIQPWIDSSCSKTINVPTDIPFEEFKDVYLYAYNKGCKAVSTYRYNPETLGAILSRSDDLEKSRYEFTLDDGTVVVCKGNDIITYDGETTTAENLFSALKEKTYGKF